MSDMLEQAIVDAKALKEAALKSAETTILEKYSSEIKEAVSTLLEQGEAMPGQVDDDFIKDVPPAYSNPELDGPKLDEEITIDFDALKAKLEEEELAGEEATPEELIPAEETAEEFAAGPEVPGAGPLLGAPEGMLEEDEEIEIDSDNLKDMLEELLAVDITPQTTGQTPPSAAERLEDELDIAKAKEQENLEEDEDEEDNKENKVFSSGNVPLTKELKEANNRLRNYSSQIKNLKENNKDLKNLLNQAKNKLLEINLSNAKLFYTNIALSSDSLNERQKAKIVDAISNASSLKEAKVIHETLQNAVGSTPKTEPKSLREAVNKRTSLIINSNSRTNSEAPMEDPALIRMKVLAGLK